MPRTSAAFEGTPVVGQYGVSRLFLGDLGGLWGVEREVTKICARILA